MAKHSVVETTYDTSSPPVVDVRGYTDAFVVLTVTGDGDGDSDTWAGAFHSCDSGGSVARSVYHKYTNSSAASVVIASTSGGSGAAQLDLRGGDYVKALASLAFDAGATASIVYGLYNK